MAQTFAWMAWTTPVAIFFGCIVLMLAGMTIWEIRSPTIERKGFLPLRTTRGDRLFIGLLTAAYINLAWVGLTDINQLFGTAISFIVLVIVMARG
jgi:predicted small integral membrane protein